MTILFLCYQLQINKGWYREWLRAFHRRGIRIIYVNDDFCPDGKISQLLGKITQRPALILHPEGLPLLPIGLAEVDVPTACFQVDTNAYVHRRLRWSMLFDYTLLAAPEFEEQFREAGHPRPITFPCAVQAHPFQDLPSDEGRPYEVAWVGRLDGPLYATRRRMVPQLANCFRMNEWWRVHSYEEMANVFKRAKIVVNIGRDDYPRGPNQRCFETMASGALLLAQLPTGLADIGFCDGEHFVGYRNETEVPALVRYFLQHEKERRGIAGAGREKVLREHTYDQRVTQLLRLLEEDRGRLFAPARQWPESEVRLVYLDYYAAHRSLCLAWEQNGAIIRRSPLTALKAIRPLVGALLHFVLRAS